VLLLHETRGLPLQLVEGVCIAYEMRRLLQSVVRIGTNSTQSGGDPVLVRVGHVSPLPWLPMPIMGCGLNSSNPSWDCFAGFQRLERKALGDAAVATALGPTRSPVEERYPSADNRTTVR